MSEMEHLRTVITSLERRDETSPGELMTFGWADIACERGDGERRFYCFVAILKYSNTRQGSAPMWG